MMEINENDIGSFVAMVVRDAEVMLGFYQEVLGMEKAFTDTGDEGVTKHYLRFNGGMLKLFAPDKPPEARSGDMMASTGYCLQTFLVTNMTELFKSFEEKGVRIITPIQDDGKGPKWGAIADPEGNPIEFAGQG